MTNATAKLLSHRILTAAFLCVSISSISIAHAAITEVILTEAPVFDDGEGEMTASLHTNKGFVMLTFKDPNSAVEKKLARAKNGSCLSLGTKDAIIVKGETVNYSQYLKSVSPCKLGTKRS